MRGRSNEGRSLFFELLRHRGVDPFRYAFDLLWLDGDDLRGLTLIERAPRPKKGIPSPGFTPSVSLPSKFQLPEAT